MQSNPPFCIDLYQRLSQVPQHDLLKGCMMIHFALHKMSYIQLQQDALRSLPFAKARLLSNLQMIYRSLTHRNLMDDLEDEFSLIFNQSDLKIDPVLKAGLRLNLESSRCFLQSSLFFEWSVISSSILPLPFQFVFAEILFKSCFFEVLGNISSRNTLQYLNTLEQINQHFLSYFLETLHPSS